MPELKNLRELKLLRNISVAYRNGMYIGGQIAKNVPVDKKTDHYPVFGKEIFNIPDTVRSRRSTANVIDYELSKDTYRCREHELRHPIDPEQISQNETIESLQAQGIELCTDGLLADKEKKLATLISDPDTYLDSNVASFLAASKWDADGSKPDMDIDTAINLGIRRSGIRFNTFIAPPPIHNILKRHPRLTALLGSNERKILTPEELAKLLNVRYYLTPDLLQNQAPAGVASSLDFVYGNMAALAYVPEKPGLKTPAFMYTFMLTGYDSYLNYKDGYATYEWFDEDKRVKYVGAGMHYDMKIVCQEAGFLFHQPISNTAFEA